MKKKKKLSLKKFKIAKINNPHQINGGTGQTILYGTDKVSCEEDTCPTQTATSPPLSPGCVATSKLYIETYANCDTGGCPIIPITNGAL